MLDIIDLINEPFDVTVTEIDSNNKKDIFEVLAEEGKFRLEFKNASGDHDYVMACSADQLEIFRINVHKINMALMGQLLEKLKKDR